MFIIVPITCFGILWIAIPLLEPRVSWRRAFLSASVIWGVTLTAITELLSYFHALTFDWVLASWGLVLVVVCGVVAFGARKRWRNSDAFANWLFTLQNKIPGYDLLRTTPLPLLVALAGALAIVAITATIGVASAPNNWDSMTYHLARVMFWIEHRSVALYPTDIMRQLYETPWAEFCIAQLYLLSGGDQFSALVQWWSMLGSLIGVSLIAWQLGAQRAGQIFAVVFAATIPMGILQASSTQNDYVVTFWLVCFIHFLLVFRQRPYDLLNGMGLGASLGLAMLTKATTYMYALPFLLLLAFWAIRRIHWRIGIVAIAAGSIAILLSTGYYLRNISAFGTLFGPPDEVGAYPNARFTFSTLISNFIRDLALQIGTPSVRVNVAIDYGIHLLFQSLGINITDKATSWAPFAFNALSLHEDYAGNPLHLLVIVAVVILGLASSRLRANRLLLVYIATLIASFLVFALYLKWSPWNSRLELVFFVLFAPACGVAISRLTPRAGLSVIALALVLASTPWVIANKSRPLIGPTSIFTTPRVDQYFANRRTLEPAYLGVASYLSQRQCATVGLVDNIDDWEYPWWILLNPGDGSLDIEHVNVVNDTRVLANSEPYTSFHPCAIIVNRNQAPASLTYHGVQYILGWKSSPIEVYTLQ